MAGEKRVSAEQLAIAMMSDARSLYAIASKRNTSQGHDVAAGILADRLARWASDVRQLGVELHNSRAGHDTTADIARAAVAKLQAVREIAARWDHLAVRDQLLEVLDG